MIQIDLQEAFKLAGKGKEIYVLSPQNGGAWKDLAPDTLQNMLDGCLLFRREPAMESSGLLDVLQEDKNPPNTDGDVPGASGGTAEPTGKRVGAGGKRKAVDTGKILALHNAGWSNVKIADEMKMNVKTVWYYIDKARKGTQDERKDKVQ